MIYLDDKLEKMKGTRVGDMYKTKSKLNTYTKK